MVFALTLCGEGGLLLNVSASLALVNLCSGSFCRMVSTGVRVHHQNMRDRMCCHVMVWHCWVRVAGCAGLQCCFPGVGML